MWMSQGQTVHVPSWPKLLMCPVGCHPVKWGFAVHHSDVGPIPVTISLTTIPGLVLPVLSGFGAAVSGCFFALESVLRGAPLQGSPPSLTTAMILLASVLAAVVSEQGLGSEPAVRVPLYEFRSPAGETKAEWSVDHL